MSNPSRTLPALAVPPGGAEEQAQIGLAAAPALGEPVPPARTRHPATHTIHGETRIDEYFWLRNRDDPEVIAYLEAENRYTGDVMRPHRGAAGAALRRRCAARIKETDLSVPERIDGWLYYPRTEAGAQYPDLLPPARRPTEVAARKSCSTSTPWPPGTTTSGSAPSR